MPRTCCQRNCGCECTRHKWILTGVIITIILLLVLGVLASITVYWSISDSSKAAPLCEAENECLFGVHKENFCRYEFKDRDAPCSCYTPGNGKCDGRGGCTGNATKCLGVCDSEEPQSECDNLWAFDTALASSSGLNLPHKTTCLGNACSAMAMFRALDGHDFYDLESGVQCYQLLDAKFYAANKSCITTERFVADIEGGTVYWHACFF